MTPKDYLKLPYHRRLIPETDGTWFADIVEFPGCIAVGDTPAGAATTLEEVAESWLEATIALGQQVPPPIISSEEKETEGGVYHKIRDALARELLPITGEYFNADFAATDVVFGVLKARGIDVELIARGELKILEREPTEEMKRAATALVPTWDDDASLRKWQAMWDVAKPKVR